MAGKTGRIIEQTPPGLTTVDDSDGFRHTSSSPKATGESMLTDLKLEAEVAEPVVEPTEAEKAAAATAAAAANVDPLDALDEDTILARAERREIPRKVATSHLVKRAKARRSEAEAVKAENATLKAQLDEARKKPAVAEAGAVVPAVPAEEPGVFKAKPFEKPRPQFKEPDDPYDVEAMRTARKEHDDALEAYYTERDTHTAEQTRLHTEHVIKQTTEEQGRVAAAQRATAIIYERGKTRHPDYDQRLQTFIAAGGKWSVPINEFLLQLGTADLDLAADVSAALVSPDHRAQVDKIAALPRADAHTALSLFVARLERPAAAKLPAKVAGAETQPAGPAGDVQPTTHAREPFHPGGASPESPVLDRGTPLTTIPTSQFDVFMRRADEEVGRNGRHR